MSCENEKALCKHCNESFLKTKEYFYTSYGKLKLDICKECKKEKNREYRLKNPHKKYVRKKPDTRVRNRTEEKKIYYQKNKERLKAYQRERRRQLKNA